MEVPSDAWASNKYVCNSYLYSYGWLVQYRLAHMVFFPLFPRKMIVISSFSSLSRSFVESRTSPELWIATLHSLSVQLHITPT